MVPHEVPPQLKQPLPSEEQQQQPQEQRQKVGAEVAERQKLQKLKPFERLEEAEGGAGLRAPWKTRQGIGQETHVVQLGPHPLVGEAEAEVVEGAASGWISFLQLLIFQRGKRFQSSEL